jgi:hypothetical protein
MDHSTKDENGLFHKIQKWIVPQNKKMDRSTKTKNGSFHKNKNKNKKDRSTETEIKRFADE